MWISYNNLTILGAVVASPTFSLPEYIGGVRNWHVFFSFFADNSVLILVLGITGWCKYIQIYLLLEFISALHGSATLPSHFTP